MKFDESSLTNTKMKKKVAAATAAVEHHTIQLLACEW